MMQTHRISQGIKFLTHKTGLFSPSCYLSIHKVEEEAKRHKDQCRPDVCMAGGRGSQTVVQGGEDGHDTAEAVHFGDEIGQMKRTYHGKVAILGSK